MSAILDAAHMLAALGVSGWPATPTKVWIVAFIKADGTTGMQRRAPLQVSAAILDGTNDYFGLAVDGSNVLVGNGRTANTAMGTPDPGNFYFWNSAQQNKWTLAAMRLDLSVSIKASWARPTPNTLALASQSASGPFAAFSDALVDMFIGRQMNVVVTGAAADGTDGGKYAEIAWGHGTLPSDADLQAVSDGTLSPSDLPGCWEHLRLRNSSDGLIGLKRSTTFVASGGTSAVTWDGADNPTVADPTGGGPAPDQPTELRIAAFDDEAEDLLPFQFDHGVLIANAPAPPPAPPASYALSSDLYF